MARVTHAKDQANKSQIRNYASEFPMTIGWERERMEWVSVLWCSLRAVPENLNFHVHDTGIHLNIYKDRKLN